ncbi:MAG: adenylate kinase [Micromonosporaceae bacterium]|nr:adenylate kinase [Micromonosporaceae bacterium]
MDGGYQRPHRRIGPGPRDGTGWPDGYRIWVVGGFGCGKSTLSQALAKARQLPYIELDGVFWQPGWRPADPAQFAAEVERATSGPRWIVDGQYEQLRPLLLDRVDTIIVVDARRTTAQRRIINRSATRFRARERLWNGERESLRSVTTMLVQAWRQHPRTRLVNRQLLAAAAPGVRTIHMWTDRGQGAAATAG